MMYNVNYTKSKNFNAHFDEVQEKILNRELASTLVLSNNKSELDAFVEHLTAVNEFGDVEVDKVIIGDDGDENCVIDTLSGLLRYSMDCKLIIRKNGCASLHNYNKKFKNLTTRRTMLILSDVDKLLNMDESSKIKEILLALLKLEMYSGVCVIACSNCASLECIDFKFMGAFTNKALFGVEDRSLVDNVSLGMYRSTEMLDDNEFYYFGMDSSNGMVLCV